MIDNRRRRTLEFMNKNLCFTCGSPRTHSPSRKFCLRHFIRIGLRKRDLIFSKSVYTIRCNTSRVRRERLSRRRYIVQHLRAHYIAVRTNKIPPLETIRDALLFIDNMWRELRLLHSFPLRTIRLVRLVTYLLRLDGYASGQLIYRSKWNGSPSNSHSYRKRHDTSNQAVDTHNDPPLSNS